MTLKVYPKGDYWNAETVEDVARFYTRVHHKVLQMVIVYYNSQAHRQATMYVDLSAYMVESVLE